MMLIVWCPISCQSRTSFSATRIPVISIPPLRVICPSIYRAVMKNTWWHRLGRAGCINAYSRVRIIFLFRRILSNISDAVNLLGVYITPPVNVAQCSGPWKSSPDPSAGVCSAVCPGTGDDGAGCPGELPASVGCSAIFEYLSYVSYGRDSGFKIDESWSGIWQHSYVTSAYESPAIPTHMIGVSTLVCAVVSISLGGLQVDQLLFLRWRFGGELRCEPLDCMPRHAANSHLWPFEPINNVMIWYDCR